MSALAGTSASPHDGCVRPLTTNTYLRIYRTMLLSRKFDEDCEEALGRGEPVPHFHSGIGQEALSVAAVDGLKPTDQMIYTHRGVAHLLAKGVSLREIALDLFMKEGGTNGGVGGVLHVSRPDLGVPGREGVFGTRFGVSVGLGLASRLRERDDVVVCFYGEAAGSRGALYESLNMAVLWNLPIVFIAENNGWSFSSRTEWLFPEARMSRVWRGFEIPVTEFDGNDVVATYAAVAEAVRHARAGRGPSVLEGITYRLRPHIFWDDDAYRPPREIEEWMTKDPLTRAAERLTELGVTSETLREIDQAVRREIDDALAAVGQAAAPTWDPVSKEVGA